MSLNDLQDIILRKYGLTKVIKKDIMTKNGNLGVLLYEIYKTYITFSYNPYCRKYI